MANSFLNSRKCAAEALSVSRCVRIPFSMAVSEPL
jgi:hypothetical protein